MKIKDALHPKYVIVKKPKEDPICPNCNKLKINHSRDQTENCIRARYFKA